MLNQTLEFNAHNNSIHRFEVVYPQCSLTYNMVNFLVTATIAFVSTALDDFVVQLYFMSKASIIEDEKERHEAYTKIVIGTIISNAIVILLALLGLVFELFISNAWISLLGLFPLCTGLWSIYEGIRELELEDISRKVWGYLDPMAISRHDDTELLRSHHGLAEKGSDVELGGVEKNPVTSNLHDFEKLPQADIHGDNADLEDVDMEEGRTTRDDSGEDGNGKNWAAASSSTEEAVENGGSDDGEVDAGSDGGDDNDNDSDSEGSCPVDEDELDNWFSNTARQICGKLLSPLALEVLVMNLAVSSDNIVIYTTVFVTESLATVVLTVILMFCLVLTTLGLALLTSRMELVNKFFSNYSGYLIPPLLIALGCYILSDSIIFHH